MMKFSCVLQSEASECGHACLAMIASAHGMGMGLREIRQRFPTSLRGSRLSELIGMAGHLGMSSRALKLDLKDLSRLKTPCVLHWGMNHFLVLRKVTATHLVVADPARGDVNVGWHEASGLFTGVALELTPTAGFVRRSPAPRVRIRSLVGDIRGWVRAAVVVLLLSAALQVFVILSPLFLQWTIDHVLGGSDSQLLVMIGVAFLGITILQSAIGYFRGWVVVSLSTQVGYQWQSGIFAHLLALPVPFFEKRHLGDILSRVGSANHIQRTVTTSFIETLIDGAMALLTLSMMFFYSWKLAIVTMAASLCYLLVRTIVFRRYRNRTEAQLAASARLQSFLMESVRGIQTLKLTGKESHRKASFNNLLHDSISKDASVARIDLAFATLSGLIFGAERVAVIWLGSSLVLGAGFSVGMLVAYLAYREQFSGRVSGLIEKWIEFRMLRLHGERLADVLLSKPEVIPSQFTGERSPERFDIDVDDVWFRYGEGEPWVVSGCSFRVAEGRSVAIAGASGCGKTTLVKLMLGLLKPQKGHIRVGGVDIANVHPDLLRRSIAAVMQEDQLFAGTIADNIAFGEDDASVFHELVAAAKAAGIHDDIESMPMGYRTLIGDMGSTLSGGQKQRLILARALYRRPELLFLDEATSHLDVKSERIVNAAIANLNITRVIVAHRPETISSADVVLTIQGERIVETRQAPSREPALDPCHE